jgi:uncharacterized membrane protein YjfL (UPF0719 family)
MILSDKLPGDLVSTLIFGLIAIILLLIGYKGFDKITPGVSFDAELAKGNKAVAIVIGAFILGLCWVIVTVVSSIVTCAP